MNTCHAACKHDVTVPTRFAMWGHSSFNPGKLVAKGAIMLQPPGGETLRGKSARYHASVFSIELSFEICNLSGHSSKSFEISRRIPTVRLSATMGPQSYSFERAYLVCSYQ